MAFNYADYEMIPRPQNAFDRIFKVAPRYTFRKAKPLNSTADPDPAVVERERRERRRAQRRVRDDDHDAGREPIGGGAPEKSLSSEATMNTTRILKNLRRMGEVGAYELIQKYADSVRQPSETSAMAFSRVFCANDRRPSLSHDLQHRQEQRGRRE
jgi:hypothetical protein